MDLQPKLATLAASLRGDRDKLLNEWLGTLRVGMEKPGGALNEVELRDHFADLLEDLSDQLEIPLTENSEISALKHAEIHGDARWTQGYKLPELIREVAALRTVLIRAVVAHGHSRLSPAEQSFANIIVHRFFDALVVESATFFAVLSQDAAVLQERQHLAKELHDSACQTIQAPLLELAEISSYAEPSTADQLNGITRALSQGLADVRTIVHGLVALVRKFEEGLPAALEEFGAGLSRIVHCVVCCDTGLDIPAKQGFQLFRIAQEAAGNACKHGEPKNLFISLVRRDDAFELQIRDDGRGFEASQETVAGVGIFNMKQRARSIGALLSISSEPGTGTTITCVVPKAVAPASEAGNLPEAIREKAALTIQIEHLKVERDELKAALQCAQDEILRISGAKAETE